MTPPNTRTDIETWEQLNEFCSEVGLPTAELTQLLSSIESLRNNVSDMLSRCVCLELPPEKALDLVNRYEASIPHRNGIKGTIVQFVHSVLQKHFNKKRGENDAKILRQLMGKLRELNMPAAESGMLAQVVLRLAQDKRRRGSRTITLDEVRQLFKEKFPKVNGDLLGHGVLYESRRAVELALSGKIID